MQSLHGNYKSSCCTEMLETQASNIMMNPDTRILGVSYNFQVCHSRQWNLEHKPQLGTRKTLPLLSHHFQVKDETFFHNQTLKQIFWTIMWVPLPLELALDQRQEQGGERSGNNIYCQGTKILERKQKREHQWTNVHQFSLWIFVY